MSCLLGIGCLCLRASQRTVIPYYSLQVHHGYWTGSNCACFEGRTSLDPIHLLLSTPQLSSSTMSDITDSANNNKLVSTKKFQTARGSFITRMDTRGHSTDQAGFIYPTNQQVGDDNESSFWLNLTLLLHRSLTRPFVPAWL